MEEEVRCFRCSKPAIGLTSILTGTKDATPIHERDVAVCEDCYAILKTKGEDEKQA